MIESSEKDCIGHVAYFLPWRNLLVQPMYPLRDEKETWTLEKTEVHDAE
jgi:hypothetical protein